jgi:phosphoketolase
MTASADVDPLAHLSSEEELQRIDAWWRAANYLAVGMIDLRANPLLADCLLARFGWPWR